MLAATAAVVQISVAAMHSWAVKVPRDIAKVVLYVQIQAATGPKAGAAVALEALGMDLDRACTVHRVVGVVVAHPE